MARIAGVDLPKDKPIKVALQYIYGIGPTLSQQILATAGVDPGIRVRDLTEEQVSQLHSITDNSIK